jgi:uncharacterized protein with FMN-binding domain
MRRAYAVVLGTVAGTTLLVGAKLGTRAPAGADSVAVDAPAGSGVPVPEASASGAAPPPTTTGTPGIAATTGRPPATSPPPPLGGGRPSSPAPPAGGLKNGTFTGSAVTERYGTIQVTIVVSGGRMADASATYPTGGETGSINQRAIPRLRQQALTAQSASISTVSGATYTSTAYKSSLQSALDKAKA